MTNSDDLNIRVKISDLVQDYLEMRASSEYWSLEAACLREENEKLKKEIDRLNHQSTK